MTTTWQRMRRNHPRRLDVIGGAALIAIVGVGATIDQTGHISSLEPVSGLLGLVSALAVFDHRRHPRAVTAATLACTVLLALTSPRLTIALAAPLLCALYFLAVRTDRSTALRASITSAVLLTGIALTVQTGGSIGERLGVLAWALLPGALGDSIRNRRAHLAAIEERAERAERTREEEARRRVADERIRIARDLHDVVAHHIALANAQAGIAVHLMDSHPVQAREVLSHITDATGSALQELRATVGLLRRAEEPAPLEPTPGLDRLPELIGSFERAGLPVRLTVRGEARPLSPGVDLTAFRIVQESLTNVAKHAHGADAEVTLAYSESRVAVSVANGRPSTTGRPRAALLPQPAPGESGFGLIGMRERAGAVGGRLAADARPDGGFLVTAELPLRTGARDDGPVHLAAGATGAAEGQDHAVRDGSAAHVAARAARAVRPAARPHDAEGQDTP
ncbi:signal transduction histidine kinase [Streptomyces sp. 1114.5]|uniref:sensor histidine kinase n=1 Tax=Streptomyces sp. 1114.5 TaxID=1938830 RepID=UPI000F248B93|nr:histidine kinase [Streptomyces sp. 1114.5]RKT08792.1 signal transduction histidine kinase [Streptomyces sp. 1114.5]